MFHFQHSLPEGSHYWLHPFLNYTLAIVWLTYGCAPLVFALLRVVCYMFLVFVVVCNRCCVGAYLNIHSYFTRLKQRNTARVSSKYCSSCHTLVANQEQSFLSFYHDQLLRTVGPERRLWILLTWISLLSFLLIQSQASPVIYGILLESKYEPLQLSVNITKHCKRSLTLSQHSLVEHHWHQPSITIIKLTSDDSYI